MGIFKILLAITIISFAMSLEDFLLTGNDIIDILIAVGKWIVIFIFLDYRDYIKN